MLGNKCAGQHNLKMVHFRETLASGNFLAWSSAIRVFFAAYPRAAAARFHVTVVGVTPYKLFLKVPWVNKQLASSDFTFRRRKKPDGVKYVKNGAGRTSLRLFPQPVFEKRGGNDFFLRWPGKKQVLYRHAWSFKPKTTINLC